MADAVRRLLAPNPGPMTLEGTNTWLLGTPGAGGTLVVDPGPLDDGHLGAVLAAAGEVAAVLLTHRHHDHADAAAELARRAGCGVRAADPTLVSAPAGHPARGLAEGDRLRAPGVEVEVLATRGHTGDSVSLLVTGDDGVPRLLTGDTVLGRGTTVIAEPDGDLADYLATLRRLRAVVEQRGVAQILPGHGPVVDDPASVLEAYLAHREERLAQVRAALAAGATSADEVVDAVYGPLEPTLRAAARQSVKAQLHYGESQRRGSA